MANDKKAGEHSSADVEVPEGLVENAVAEGGAYEVIRKRLLDQGKQLREHTEQLNQARLNEFGTSEMSVLSRVRVRTENNCLARDVVQVGQHLLFGYNVFIGLKKETKVDDVFALFQMTESEAGAELSAMPLSNSFLSDQRFISDFDELYRYYKNARLLQLSIINDKLLAGFQIGEKHEDIRVFRWSVSSDGEDIRYIDNRGERDIQLPPPFDFEWQASTRDDIVHGRSPHINVLDTLFVDTLNGDLSVKIENNTEQGLAILSEPVEDTTQSLTDVDIEYAKVGQLILLRVLPYREEQHRYYCYNTLTQTISRIDAIGQSCVQLPEDHGIIFPGGYYLESGEYKEYGDDVDGLQFKRCIRSPNGEDVLYVFYEPKDGVVGLFSYNLIERSLMNPIYGHGYARFENGHVVIFSAEPEPTRIHPMQIWETPFFSDEFASQRETRQNFYGRIGNAELVRGVSDLYSVARMVDNQSVSLQLYEEIQRTAKKLFDDYYWITDAELEGIGAVLEAIVDTAELVVDEFEKVESIRQQSASLMREAETQQEALIRDSQPDHWVSPEQYVEALQNIRYQRGHLTTIRDNRYIDLARIDELDEQLVSVEQQLSEQTLNFLKGDTAFSEYDAVLDRLDKDIEKVTTNAELAPVMASIDTTAQGLDLLSELVSTLDIDDATVTTRIVDVIADIYSQLNQRKARAKLQQKNLGSAESVAQFSAQFKLFSQSITNAMSQATTPDRCDEQLSRLLVKLEELESQFSDHEEFLVDIISKREELYQSFEAHKQQLLEERQRKSHAIKQSADRVLKSIEKRALSMTEADKLNAFFAADALVKKTRELGDRLRDLDASVAADDVDARLKAIKEQAIRALRDKTDIYEDGGQLIRLGPKHKFSVNTQELSLTLLPRDDDMFVHLTGTRYFEAIEDDELLALKPYWAMSVESETDDVYRAEYLAASILQSAQDHRDGLTMESLRLSVADPERLQDVVKDFAAPRYKEGYEKGVHDHDAALILRALVPVMDAAGLLIFDPQSRALAQVFWFALNHRSNGSELARFESVHVDTWVQQAKSAALLKNDLESHAAFALLRDEIEAVLRLFVDKTGLVGASTLVSVSRAAEYLVAELSSEHLSFVSSQYATQLIDELKASLSQTTFRSYQKALEQLGNAIEKQWALSEVWFDALLKKQGKEHLSRYVPEAIAMLITHGITRHSVVADLEIVVSDLLGEHGLIRDRQLSFSVDSFLQRTAHHQHTVIPAYHHYLETRHQVLERERDKLRVEEFKARPLSSFVRNRLINEAYLPIIGDNLAKQMGTAGESKRTDLMGLLMMISPPGYGKTTLMEYVASRLGLIFMKINCPSLGHDVMSVDPEQAPNATARKELIKLNLALEMGDNVMLYLDDIQHTHPEFLQKFISLCDGTRRIEGVWKGVTKTYDMRGRKFCVVMAGNPYTESGEVFKVPDMLANRADIYNLGDILGGMEEPFALSYIENSLTSNAVLAPLALRDIDDVYSFVNMAKGENIPTTALKHQYSGAEINEIKDVLSKLFVIQDIILKVNQAYIASAAQDDNYRTEPPFKLQGSYRNMNKMAEKVTSVMNESELMTLISDHYLGESQLLTSESESNLLKLAEIRGNMSEEEQSRWEQIKSDFVRNRSMGGEDASTGDKVVMQLVDIVRSLNQLGELAAEKAEEPPILYPQERHVQEPTLQEAQERSHLVESLNSLLKRIENTVSMDKDRVDGTTLTAEAQATLEAVTKEVSDIAQPLISKLDKKLSVDLRTYFRLTEITKKMRDLV